MSSCYYTCSQTWKVHELIQQSYAVQQDEQTWIQEIRLHSHSLGWFPPPTLILSFPSFQLCRPQIILAKDVFAMPWYGSPVCRQRSVLKASLGYWVELSSFPIWLKIWVEKNLNSTYTQIEQSPIQIHSDKAIKYHFQSTKKMYNLVLILQLKSHIQGYHKFATLLNILPHVCMQLYNDREIE